MVRACGRAETGGLELIQPAAVVPAV